MGGSKKLILFYWIERDICQYQMQYIKENAVAAVVTAPPLNPPMINLTNGLPLFCTYMYTQ